ncbi:MAG TPA: hypothetical protein DDW91_12955, partial [Shewanella frigidimarina]|nr:hypothetical protein [Shewanella frigidimarina]
EQVTRELELPLYQEEKSGIVWALRETREGSVLNEFVGYAVQLAGDESFRTYIESGIYDLGKMAFGAAFISLPQRLSEKLKEKRQKAKQITAEKEQIETS